MINRKVCRFLVLRHFLVCQSSFPKNFCSARETGISSGRSPFHGRSPFQKTEPDQLHQRVQRQGRARTRAEVDSALQEDAERSTGGTANGGAMTKTQASASRTKLRMANCSIFRSGHSPQQTRNVPSNGRSSMVGKTFIREFDCIARARCLYNRVRW